MLCVSTEDPADRKADDALGIVQSIRDRVTSVACIDVLSPMSVFWVTHSALTFAWLFSIFGQRLL